MFKADLHVHTANSYDATGSPEEVLAAAKAAGLDGIAVTEHHTYEKSEVFLELASGYGLTVFMGAEVSTRAGHMLIFSEDIRRWNRFDQGGNDPQAIIDEVNEAGGAAVFAHPFRMALGLGGYAVRQLRGLAAIEGCNGANRAGENKSALELAATMGLPSTGGSDAHRPVEIGRCYTVFTVPLFTLSDLVAALKAGSCRGVDTVNHEMRGERW